MVGPSPFSADSSTDIPFPASGETAVQALLSVRDLTCARGGRTLFSHLDFDLLPGSLTAVLGANGAGKSTLLSIIEGLERPDGGQVLVQGKPVGKWPRKELARTMGILWQAPEAAWGATVRDVVALGRSPWQDALGTTGPEDADAIRQAMEEASVTPLADRKLETLSGGERRRVFLAQVLSQKPQILLLDEPTASLDVGHQAAVLKAVSGRMACGLSVVAVLHDPNQAAMADQVVMIHPDGEVDVGPAAGLLTQEKLSRLYGTPIRLLRDAEGRQAFVHEAALW